jgi:hypothetical protein
MITPAIAAAQRKVDAIDKRIDAVRAELLRNSRPFDEMSAEGWQRAWDSYPGLQGIERSLFLRRADATDIRDGLIWTEARKQERREAREFQRAYEARRRSCIECGQTFYAAA